MSVDPHDYVSFHTALSIHGLIDDVVHCTQIATICGDLRREIPGIGTVEWIALPDDLIFGSGPGSPLDFPDWQVAEPEKALCDLLWWCESRGFAVPIFSLRLDDLDPAKLQSYADLVMVHVPRLGELKSPHSSR